jgi:meiotic recombination protein SPO11
MQDLGTSKIPVYGLFDYDPDGLGIFSVYKSGSFSLAHENNVLNVPCIHWLGLQSTDIYRSDIIAHQGQGLLQLSGRDRRKARSMLSWHFGSESSDHEVWHRELQVMLILNLKAEIQLLDGRQGGLVEWLSARIVV